MSTRDRILKEAGKLFYHEGVHAVGMERICQASGVTKPTLYHHFGSKDDLIAAYIHASHEFIWSKYVSAINSVDGTVTEKLFALIDQIEYLSSKPAWNGCSFLRLASDLNAQRDHPAYQAALDHKLKWEKQLEKLLEIHGVENSQSKGKTISLIIDGATSTATLHNDRSYFDSAKDAVKTILSE